VKFKLGPMAMWVRLTEPTTQGRRQPRVRGVHWCGCERCDADLAPSGHRLGVAHFAVHLGDRWLQPLLAGADLDHCSELVVGVGGWAICTSQPDHACGRCGAERCQYRIYSDELSVVGLPHDTASSALSFTGPQIQADTA
jgi:hypothetical protein